MGLHFFFNRTKLNYTFCLNTSVLCHADCGAGVGRVAIGLLIHLFDEVDLLEPSEPLLQHAKNKLLGPGGSVPEDLSSKIPPGHRVVNFYQKGLQEHTFEPGRYDCIW